ncbi:MAG: PBS lyase [Gammaproteobacteria bacterium]|nr:PBS lyase [Gammaproteobacteria bacterium]
MKSTQICEEPKLLEIVLSEKYTFPVDQLLTYGNCQDIGTNFDDWPDYLELGFTNEHVPQLIQMATDAELEEASSDSLDVWAPIHAWRTLAQLGSEEAIIPLMDSFWRSEDGDEWFLEEIPYVFGMIGVSTLPALTNFLFEGTNSNDACSLACSCLRQIGKMHLQVRDDCISLITRKLEEFDVSNTEFNALVISDLIDMEAVEALPTIKQAYEKECVDYSIQGDYEDVEIYMGVRKKRATPVNYPGILD